MQRPQRVDGLAQHPRGEHCRLADQQAQHGRRRAQHDAREPASRPGLRGFFLQPSVDALTYAGDHGIDVADMSYFIDPWLYNCGNPLHPVPEDSPDEQAEQKTIIEATQRALDYAHLHGVTLVAALGNGHEDVGLPLFDGQSPNFPPGTAHPRTVNNTCLDLPTEGNNVISVSSVGPSRTKADYSNWSYEETTVAAPGGWFRDTGWPANPIPNQILAAYPRNVAEDNGQLNDDGTPNTPFVLRDCRGWTSTYYRWIQGTSMASPTQPAWPP